MSDSEVPDTPEKSPTQLKKKAPDKSMIFMGMGIEAVAAILGGFWVGLKLDGYLGNKSMGPGFGAILGLVGWFVHLSRVVKNFDVDS